MTLFMNTLERYLGRVLIGHTLLVLGVLLMIFGFTEFMLQLSKINESYTLAKAVFYTLLKLPVYAYDIFPVALLIGALMGLGGLANHSELTILRVTGWSIRRIFLGVMKTTFLLWLVFTLIGEWLAPQAESYSQKLRSEAINGSISVGYQSDFWMKDEGRFIYVEQVVSDTQFLGVEIYHLSDGQVQSRWLAESADFVAGETPYWQLKQGQIFHLHWQTNSFNALDQAPERWLSKQVEPFESRSVELPITPEMLSGLRVDTRYMNVLDLWVYIDFLQSNGLDAEPYKLAFWRKIAAPLAAFGMLALVFPLIFGSQRQVSMGQRIFVGIMIGLGFHLLNQIVGNLTVVYQLPTWLGAFAPSLILIAIAMNLFRRLR